MLAICNLTWPFGFILAHAEGRWEQDQNQSGINSAQDIDETYQKFKVSVNYYLAYYSVNPKLTPRYGLIIFMIYIR